VAADNLADAGVTVVASIGNSGANGGQLWSAGAPGVGRNVIGVAFVRQHEGDPAGVPRRHERCTLQPGGRLAFATVPQSGSAELVASG